MRVIVIGSGIAGLSCAIGLRKIGCDVNLYERASSLCEVGAGIMIWANGLRAFDALGIGDSIREVTLPARRLSLARQNGRRVQLSIKAEIFEQQLGYSPFVGFIYRPDLVGCLAAHLPKGIAHYGCEFVGLEQDERRVVARFANGRSDEADLLIGADGIKSLVRSNLFGLSPLRYSGYTCWRGVCSRPPEVQPGDLYLWTGRGSQVGINTLTRDRVYWFATRNAKVGEKSADERAAVLNIFRHWAKPLPDLIASTPADRIIRTDIADRRPSRPWFKGRVVLIGDAAHPMTPNFGQGGGMAIEDAVVLTQCLTTVPCLQEAFALFENRRFPRTSAVTDDAWRFGKILQWEGRLSVALRDMFTGILLRRFGANNLIKYARYNVGCLPNHCR
jgi:2-polyprenyl-6-methoxyphenol hydroxylase-like FAD-dependent oxidoreductase